MYTACTVLGVGMGYYIRPKTSQISLPRGESSSGTSNSSSLFLFAGERVEFVTLPAGTKLILFRFNWNTMTEHYVGKS